VWIVQFAVGTIAPALNLQRKFVYHTVMLLVSVCRDSHDTTFYENMHVEAIHQCRMWSSCRDDAETISSMDCEADSFSQHENELAFKLLPYFHCVMSKKAICYTGAGKPTLLVGRQAREYAERREATNKAEADALRESLQLLKTKRKSNANNSNP